MNGVLLIAIGDNYLQLAYNLLKTIKTHNPNLKVALITDEKSKYFLSEFDYLIEPKLCDMLEGNRMNPFKLKTFINQYTPFDKTLYLDVDSLCLKPFEELFLNEFLIQEVGRYSYEDHMKCDMVWVRKAGLTIKDIFDAYKIPKERLYPEYNSSVILFTKAHDLYFDNVRRAYNDRRIAFKAIGGRYPDELAFNLASILTKTYNEKLIKPMYFQWENKAKMLTEITQNYYFLGMAGGFHGAYLKNMYEALVKHLDTPFKKFQSNKKIFHEKK